MHQLINDLVKNHFPAFSFIISHSLIMAFCHFKIQFSLWKLSSSRMCLDRLAGEYLSDYSPCDQSLTLALQEKFTKLFGSLRAVPSDLQNCRAG